MPGTPIYLAWLDHKPDFFRTQVMTANGWRGRDLIRQWTAAGIDRAKRIGTRS